MRNFNDFIRALGGIHNVLSGIAGKIDLIPAGGSGSAEWSMVSGSGETYDTLSTTATEYDAEGKAEAMLYVFNNSEFIPPMYVSLADLTPLASGSIHCRFTGNTYANLTITKSDNTLSIATTAGTITAYVFLR